MIKSIIDQSVFYNYYQKYLKKIIYEQLYEYLKKIFNLYFESVTDSLELFNWYLQSSISYDKVQNIVKTFSNNLSIIKIKQKIKLD